VSSYNGSGHYSAWSLVRSFRTALPKPTTLNQPADNETFTLNRPLFDWDDIPGATGYTIQISHGQHICLHLVNENTVTSTYTPAKDLPANQTPLLARDRQRHKWTVTAFGFLQVHDSQPTPCLCCLHRLTIFLISNTLTPKLDWANVTAPIGITLGGYQLEVATDTAFSSAVLTQNVTSTTGTPPVVVSEFTLTTPLSSNTKYYWHVRSYDSGNHYSSWSLVRSFRNDHASACSPYPASQ